MRRNLERRGMDVDTRCVLCNRGWEDGSHLFFNCKHVKRVWQVVGMEEKRKEFTELTSSLLMIQHLVQLEEDLQVKVVVLLWQWWNERNNVREGAKQRAADLLSYEIERNSAEFLAMGSPNPAEHMGIVQNWRKPEEVLKINSDGAFVAQTGEGGWGFVIRDKEGEVIYAGAGKLEHLRDALQAEIRACLEGTKGAAEMGLGRVVVETDSLILKNSLKDNSYRLAEAGGAILELKNFIREHFFSCVVNYVPRSCNKVAHALAAKGTVGTERNTPPHERWKTSAVAVPDHRRRSHSRAII
ncbi:hypothetical protein C2845_PM03G24330 [Panicum miliaceum]|uniref:RNase H type-1 domain-containing protein n=1 Tax=Panicum miliaceum TaxID=4540 RepID=A0A3L6T660_PANMI|nr:hypothetical protein C2845_PM03G24330 [Panicum miliaceum]